MTTPSKPLAAPVQHLAAPQLPPECPPQRWRSDELLGARQEVEIEHGPAVYRLRLTALGKLILTK